MAQPIQLRQAPIAVVVNDQPFGGEIEHRGIATCEIFAAGEQAEFKCRQLLGQQACPFWAPHPYRKVGFAIGQAYDFALRADVHSKTGVTRPQPGQMRRQHVGDDEFRCADDDGFLREPRIDVSSSRLTPSTTEAAIAAIRSPSRVSSTPSRQLSSRRSLSAASSASSRRATVDTATPRAFAAPLSEPACATARSQPRSLLSMHGIYWVLRFPPKLFCTLRG